MEAEGINLAEQRRDEEEIEFILGALPNIWQNTQNVLRDLGYQRQPLENADLEPQEGLKHRQTSDRDSAGDGNAWTSGSKTTFENEDEVEEKVCRMCFSSEDELGDDGMSLGRLIAPCHCDGSMRYVHDTCLDQWRRKSAASEAARVCGQCHARYRFRRRPYSNLMAFVQASQMLRVLFCVLIIFLSSFIFGIVALGTLRAVAGLESTPLSFVRDAALRQLQVDRRPWNITLHQDEAVVDVWMPADILQRSQGGLIVRVDPVVYEKADLEVFSRVRQQQLHNPVYWKLVKKPRSSFRANYTDRRIIRAKLTSGEDVSEELDRLSQGLPLFPLDDWYYNVSKASDHHNSTAAAQSTLSGLQTPYGLSPSLRERLNNFDFKLGFKLPFLASEQEEDIHSDEIELWSRQDLNISFIYEESPADVFPDPLEHFLVRSLPEWLGFLRYVPYGFVLAMIDRFHFVASVFQPWWSSIARSSLQLALLVLESRRELMWMASKAAVAGLIAYVDVKFEPVRWNPENAIVMGPPRTQRRKAAAVVREVLVIAADSVFGPLWLNWWGGYSLSVYLAPREFMTTERVEMTQLAAVFAPAITLLLDVTMGGLGTFWKRAARFQASHTSKWASADFVHNDFSASEGYRRMIATLLGDKEASQASLYDLWLETKQSGLLPGRTRPLQMAVAPKISTWRTVMLLGCLVTTTVALLIATKLAWDTTISHFARQAWRSLVSIFQLIMHSGYSFRQFWRHTRDTSLLIVRYTTGKVKAYAQQLLRSIRRIVAGNRHGSAQDDISHSDTADSPQHGDINGTADAAAQTDEPQQQQQEAIPEPLINDPFLQGAHMGILGAILGHVASIYGCLHAFVFTMRFILVYLPFEPFMIVYSLLQKLIQVDVANTEVLDREDPAS